MRASWQGEERDRLQMLLCVRGAAQPGREIGKGMLTFSRSLVLALEGKHCALQHPR